MQSHLFVSFWFTHFTGENKISGFAINSVLNNQDYRGDETIQATYKNISEILCIHVC